MVIKDGSIPSVAAVLCRKAAANAIAAALVVISSAVRKQSANASEPCRELANSFVTCSTTPPPAPPPAHPGSSSPSVEMPASTIADGSTPRLAAVDARNASANAIAAGLVNISSGVR